MKTQALHLPRPSWRTCWKVLQSRCGFPLSTLLHPAAQQCLSITAAQTLMETVSKPARSASLPHILAPCLSVWRFRCAFLPVALTSHFKTRLLRSGSPGSVVHLSIQILRKTVPVLWSVFGKLRDLNQCTPHYTHLNCKQASALVNALTLVLNVIFIGFSDK